MYLGRLGRHRLRQYRHPYDGSVARVGVEVGNERKVDCGGIAHGFEASGGVEVAGCGTAAGGGRGRSL
jgi:hypothetical protein